MACRRRLVSREVTTTVRPTSSTTRIPKRTVSVTSRSIDFIKDQVKADAPFYVQVSYYAQHLSVVTSERALAKYREKGTPDRGYTQAWAAMMEELDAGVGRLIDAVGELGIDQNTYIFLTADNGGRGTVPGGDNRLPPTNVPLTGAKHSLYEGGIRVPFIVRGPRIGKGSVCRVPVVGYDFLPTFVELAGGEASQLPEEVDGASFKPLLLDPVGRSLARNAGAIIFHRPNKLFSAIRTDDWKLMLFWKPNGEVDHRELYDLSADPTEEGNDLADAQPARAEAMQAKLLQFLSEVNADKPRPRKPSPKRKKS